MTTSTGSVLNARVDRLPTNPIIVPHMDDRMGDNINGPSLIRVPEWLPNPLGRYYLYFAHHQGRYIRLAVADDLEGPWRTHRAGVLDVDDSYFLEHIASPDVHVDHDQREIRMYFHGLLDPGDGRPQGTRVATSNDGLHFDVHPPLLAPRSYLRVFDWDGWVCAWSMSGIFWRSPDGLQPFEHIPWPEPRLPTFREGLELARCDRWPGAFPFWARHGAVHRRESTLLVVYTMAQARPERLVYSVVDLSAPWGAWTATAPAELLAPELVWEGSDLPMETSGFGAVWEPVRQLRDPGIFEDDDGSLYLLYSVAGESGIAIARLTLDVGGR